MRKLVVAFGFACLAGAALAEGQTPDQIRYRLDVLDAEIQALRAQLGGGGPIVGGAAVDLSRLEAEIARLTNSLEQLRYRIDRLEADTELQLGDILFRLTELEGGDVSILTTPDLGGGLPDGGATGPQVAVTERRDLDDAVADVRAGRFDQAEERLRAFLRDYPGSPLTGEANYWLGESLFIRGIFQQAARAYLTGFEADRAGSHAADNLLRLGVTLGRLGQTLDACLTLQEVGRQFPGAGADVLDEAASEANRLGCG